MTKSGGEEEKEYLGKRELNLRRVGEEERIGVENMKARYR